MLDDLRGLDLTDEKGFLCGKILAELGAEVIKIEKPGGDPGRSKGPFVGNGPHPEKSLYWCAYNSSKKSITLNIDLEEGTRYLRQLVRNADFLLESFPPHYLDRLGLGYEDLSKINPEIIFTSISPFGQTGPYKDFKASDMSLMAMSGLMKITGYKDRPPLRFGLDQSYCLAGAQAAIGTLFALHERNRSEQGQHVDVSMYECLTLANYWEPPRWEFEQRLVERLGDRFSRGKGSTRQVWGCKDGYVTWTMMGGKIEIQRLRAIIEQMDREGMAGYLKTVDLDNVHISKLSDEEIKRWEEPIQAFFMKHTKKELEQFSNERNLTLCVINDLVDVMDTEQLAERGYWKDIEYPEFGRAIKSPGFLFQSSEIDTSVRFKAPSIGEHNADIFEKELGLSNEELKELNRRGVI